MLKKSDEGCNFHRVTYYYCRYIWKWKKSTNEANIQVNDDENIKKRNNETDSSQEEDKEPSQISTNKGKNSNEPTTSTCGDTNTEKINKHENETNVPITEGLTLEKLRQEVNVLLADARHQYRSCSDNDTTNDIISSDSVC